MHKFFKVLLLLSFFQLEACGSSVEQARRNFKGGNDSLVGKHISYHDIHIKPKSVIEIENSLYEHIYGFGDCKWSTTVKNEIIISWRYISDPSPCYVQSGFAP